MFATRRLLQRQPMIKFVGKRHTPKNLDHTPHVHPAAPETSLPESFAQYRNRAIQHGPLGGQQNQQRQGGGGGAPSSSVAPLMNEPYGGIGGHSGKELGSVRPAQGQVWDRNELPKRFRRRPFEQAEIDAVDSAGASMWG